jgi:hypothetical protein
MSDVLKRLEDKIDKIADTQTNQAVTLGRLTVSVEEHVRRSDQFEDALKPVQKHVYMINGALKLVGLLAMIAAIAEAIKEFIK